MPHQLRVRCSGTVRLAVMVTMVVTVLGACGGSATKPPGQSLPAAFPVTVTRTGGIAGFQDVLVVGADGLVSVTRKGQPE